MRIGLHHNGLRQASGEIYSRKSDDHRELRRCCAEVLGGTHRTVWAIRAVAFSLRVTMLAQGLDGWPGSGRSDGPPRE